MTGKESRAARTQHMIFKMGFWRDDIRLDRMTEAEQALFLRDHARLLVVGALVTGMMACLEAPIYWLPPWAVVFFACVRWHLRHWERFLAAREDHGARPARRKGLMTEAQALCFILGATTGLVLGAGWLLGYF